MISERGIFNVLYLTTADLECSEFNKEDLRNLMAHKCELLVRKNINILGSYLFQPKELKSMDQDDILDLVGLLFYQFGSFVLNDYLYCFCFRHQYELKPLKWMKRIIVRQRLI